MTVDRLLAAVLLVIGGGYETQTLAGDEVTVALDHLIYAAPTLERGMDDIEALLGVRPVMGGRHPDFGTHNALLSLGDGIYFEVIASDPQATPPTDGVLFDLDQLDDARLLSWVARGDNLDAAVAKLKPLGIDLGSPQDGQRKKPDGTAVRWSATDPRQSRLGGAIPFLIDWGDTPHPSASLPVAGELLELVIEHPDADTVRAALAAINVDVTVVQAREYALAARIATDNGIKTLR